MSQSPSESESSGEHETPEVGLIPDEALPEDLQPDKNPLAADPDESSDGRDDDRDGGDDNGAASGPKTDAMPDMGQPG